MVQPDNGPIARGHGDEDPFPLNRAVMLAGLGGIRKGIGEYSAFRIGPFVEVIARGTVPLGQRAELIASLVDVFPPQYALVFIGGGEIQLPVQTPFIATAHFYSKKPVDKVYVWDANGKHQVTVDPGIT